MHEHKALCLEMLISVPLITTKNRKQSKGFTNVARGFNSFDSDFILIPRLTNYVPSTPLFLVKFELTISRDGLPNRQVCLGTSKSEAPEKEFMFDRKKKKKRHQIVTIGTLRTLFCIYCMLLKKNNKPKMESLVVSSATT